MGHYDLMKLQQKYGYMPHELEEVLADYIADLKRQIAELQRAQDVLRDHGVRLAKDHDK